MPGQGGRTASVRVAGADGTAADERGVSPGGPGRRLAVALLEASPRVSLAGPGLCRADARGWERRGGEEALAHALREAAESAGFSGVRVGIADVAVAADAAVALAPGAPVRIVPPGGARAFLARLPLALLPVSEELKRTFRALGFRHIGEITVLERSELEARFGLDGLRAHRWACGEDDRTFLSLPPEALPEARLELDGPLAELEPLLFVLRHLLARVCTDLADEGKCAARLVLELVPEGSEPTRALASASTFRSHPRRPAPWRIPIVPARPTAREDLLFDLCRAVLERERSGGFLAEPISCLSLQVRRLAPAGARQGDLFARGWRDPLEAAAALSRLRARLGEEGVVWPAPRASHRPETRNRWEPVRPGVSRPVGATGSRITEAVARPTATGATLVATYALPPVLRLLPRPAPMGVCMESGWPVEVWDESGRRDVTAVEGPERLSGDWWERSYRREYYRVCTSAGELLWLFRAWDRGGKDRWWLHGWWD